MTSTFSQSPLRACVSCSTMALQQAQLLLNMSSLEPVNFGVQQNNTEAFSVALCHLAELHAEQVTHLIWSHLFAFRPAAAISISQLTQLCGKVINIDQVSMGRVQRVYVCFCCRACTVQFPRFSSIWKNSSLLTRIMPRCVLSAILYYSVLPYKCREQYLQKERGGERLSGWLANCVTYRKFLMPLFYVFLGSFCNSTNHRPRTFMITDDFALWRHLLYN